jgi:hypothetical protein
MDEKTVRKLERRIEKAVLEVISDMGLKRLPLLPSQQTMHLMAKAAVAVYEAAVENDVIALNRPAYPGNEGKSPKKSL